MYEFNISTVDACKSLWMTCYLCCNIFLFNRLHSISGLATSYQRVDFTGRIFCQCLYVMWEMWNTGCSGKIVFFHNSLQPLPRLHRCKRPSKLSTQCECTVNPIGLYFFVQPIAAECWRGKGGKLSRILGKKNTKSKQESFLFI